MDSLATKRAKERGYFDNDSTWYCEFKTEKAKGFEKEEGIHRRDPSSVILVNGTYFTWYTKSYGKSYGFNSGDYDKKVFPWDKSEIWFATSKDGENWFEEGLAVKPGDKGCYDDRSTFTPEILKDGDMYYLVYQVVQSPYLLRSFEKIALSYSTSPYGPWTKLDKPILEPSADGEWEGEDDNRFLITKRGSFDSLKTHDPVLFKYKEKYYLYYKGEPMGEKMFMGGRETKWGVAISKDPLGPYVKSEYNPVSNSGHETLLWKYKSGMAGLLCTDGMERNTMQYAEDGINFEIKGAIKCAPEAAGPFRPNNEIEFPLDGLKWGLTHNVTEDWNYIMKFTCDERIKKIYKAKKNYE
jgi:hypothetical protein